MSVKSRPGRRRSLPPLIKKNNQQINDFSTDAQTLFRFLVLVVDIKYRIKYGHRLGDGDTRYGNQEQHKKVVADQIPSVDTGLLRH